MATGTQTPASKPVTPPVTTAKRTILFEEAVKCISLTKYNLPVTIMEEFEVVDQKTHKVVKETRPNSVMREITEFQMATEVPEGIMPQIKVNVIAMPKELKIEDGKTYKLILIEA